MAQDTLSLPAACEVSVVIPAYNESTRLPHNLHATHSYLLSKGESFEIIVVDDCSKDATAEFVRAEQKNMPELKLISYSPNRGKGFAVKTGVSAAAGKVILFCDADGSTPIQELERLRKAIAEGAQVAIGSRALKSDETMVETSLRRKVIGRIFAKLTNLIVLAGVSDTQCGFKLFTREAAQKIFPKQTAERFSFDVELLLLSRLCDLKIAEVPVNWHNVDGSKVDLVRDSMQMFRDMVKFRLKWLKGDYRDN